MDGLKKYSSSGMKKKKNFGLLRKRASKRSGPYRITADY